MAVQNDIIVGFGHEGVIGTMQNQIYLNFIKKIAETKLWNSSACTCAFILLASGILKNCLSTTYWSQIPIVGLVSNQLQLTIPNSYPRFSIDRERKIVTGGGISSSLNLALEMVLILKGLEATQTTQLFFRNLQITTTEDENVVGKTYDTG